MKMPTKFFNPSTFEGESLAPMMGELAKIAQFLYANHPDFVALVPFGSRTKGLADEDSDLDLFLFFEENSGTSLNIAEITLLDSLQDLYPNLEVHLMTRCRKDYANELLLGGLGTPEVRISFFNAVLGPHRFGTTYQEVRDLSSTKKQEILSNLLEKAQHNEGFYFHNRKSLPNIPKDLIGEYIEKRTIVWKKRIKSILRIK